MTRSPIAGQAQTVLGPIAGEAMGITLPHEHLLIDFEVMFKEPANGSERGLARQPVSLANLGWVRQHFSSNLDNLQLLDEQRGPRRGSCSSSTRAARPSWIPPIAASPAIRSRSRGWPAPPGSTSSWAPATTWTAAHPPDMEARTADDGSRARSSPTSRVGVDETGCARASSARSAPRGPGRTTSGRSCGRRWRRQRGDRRRPHDPPGSPRATAARDRELHPEGRRRSRPHHHVPHRAHHRGSRRAARARRHRGVPRVRPLRARDLVLPVQSRLRHAQRRRADAPDPLPDRARTPAASSSCPTTSPTSTASRSGAASATTTSSST